MKSGYKNLRFQRGFTLIESMLTLFILTVGLLGVAGMQMEGLRSGGLAMQRTLVVVKVQEMMERLSAINTEGDSHLQAYFDVVDAASAADHGCNTGVICSDPVQMAEHDIFLWQRDLQTMLPSLTSAIISRVNGNVTVGVDWLDRGVAYSYSVTSNISYADQ